MRKMRCPKARLGNKGYSTIGCGSTNLVVTARNMNHSAFNGYRPTYSDYSEIKCLDCSTRWRSKAKGVDALPDAPTGRR